tara:strand:+ start:1412 stop:1669 length:258 start_codon:yes stop_codon:yes gene_type:complete
MTPEEAKEFLTKDSITVEGITDEYVWYHAKLLSAKMSAWDNDFKKLVKVMESRHKEHLNMVQTALHENRILRLQLKARDEQTKDT